MRTKSILLTAALVPMLLASKCEDSGSVDPDSPKSICDHIMKLCGKDFFEGDKSACIESVRPLDSCRKECAADQNSCDGVDECLWWNLGYDGEADDYCSGGGGSGSYNSLDDCVADKCASQYNVCAGNSSCTGIFDDCLQGCADWDCVELCAGTGYSDGINDFNSLWTCMTNSCSQWLQ